MTDAIRIRDLDMARVSAAILAGWVRLAEEQRERVYALADAAGGIEVRWSFEVQGRLQVWWGGDILVADLPLRDVLAGVPRLDA